MSKHFTVYLLDFAHYSVKTSAQVEVLGSLKFGVNQFITPGFTIWMGSYYKQMRVVKMRSLSLESA